MSGSCQDVNSLTFGSFPFGKAGRHTIDDAWQVLPARIEIGVVDRHVQPELDGIDPIEGTGFVST
jgi:hypothetical protein